MAQIASPLYAYSPIPLKLTNLDGSIVELVTVVVSKPQDQIQGLMHVRHLPLNQSMLFFNQPPRRMSLWMKNTHVPLDMWFVLPDFSIGFIARGTTPHSEESISYAQPVLAVIEVNSGLSDLLGVQIGSKVNFKIN